MIKLKYSFFVFLFFCFINTKAQVNLVPNPSFEDTLGDCRTVMAITSLFQSVKNWYTCYYGSSVDYFNTCVNSISYPAFSSVPYNCRTYQMPHLGEAYIGLWIYEVINGTDSSAIYSENVAVKLPQPLIKDHCYYGEFYANVGNIANMATNQLSMLLSTNIYTTTTGSFTNTIQPQIQWDTTQCFTDTLNWVKISGKFIAKGGEQFLTIGNFRDGTHLKKKTLNTGFVSGGCITSPSNRAYILLDDVALYELPTPQLGALNYTICNNSDSLLLGDTTRIQTTYQWFANGLPISTSNTIIVKPTQTTNYVLQSTQCGITNQTITVTYSTNCEPVVVTEPIIPNVFTPNNDNVNDTFKFELNNSNLKSFNVYNSWGNLIHSTFNIQHSTLLWDGRTTSGIECTAGVYFYVLEYTDVNGDTHKKNGYVTLIR